MNSAHLEDGRTCVEFPSNSASSTPSSPVIPRADGGACPLQLGLPGSIVTAHYVLFVLSLFFTRRQIRSNRNFGPQDLPASMDGGTSTCNVHGCQAANASERPFVTGDQRLQDVELGGPSASAECLTILSNPGLCSSPPAALLTRRSRLPCSSVRACSQPLFGCSSRRGPWWIRQTRRAPPPVPRARSHITNNSPPVLVLQATARKAGLRA